MKLQWCASLDSTTVVNSTMTYSKVLSFLILILLLCGILYYQRNPETEHLTMKPKLQSDRLSKAGTQSYTYVYVRHCTTDRILGKTPNGLQSVPFEVTGGTSPDNENSRKSAFQQIFKNKVWIAPRERNNSKAASGKRSEFIHSFIHCRHLYSASSSGATQKRSSVTSIFM